MVSKTAFVVQNHWVQDMKCLMCEVECPDRTGAWHQTCLWSVNVHVLSIKSGQPLTCFKIFGGIWFLKNEDFLHKFSRLWGRRFYEKEWKQGTFASQILASLPRALLFRFRVEILFASVLLEGGEVEPWRLGFFPLDTCGHAISLWVLLLRSLCLFDSCFHYPIWVLLIPSFLLCGNPKMQSLVDTSGGHFRYVP